MLAWMLGLLIVAAMTVKIIESAFVLADVFKIVREIVELATELLRSAATFLLELMTRRSSEKRSG